MLRRATNLAVAERFQPRLVSLKPHSKQEQYGHFAAHHYYLAAGFREALAMHSVLSVVYVFFAPDPLSPPHASR